MELGQAGVVAVAFGLEVRLRLLELALSDSRPLVGRLRYRLRPRHVQLEAAHRRFCLGSTFRRLASGLLGAGGSVVGSFSPGLGGRQRGSALVELLGQPARLPFVGGGCPGGAMVVLGQFGTMSGEGRFQGVLGRRRSLSRHRGRGSELLDLIAQGRSFAFPARPLCAQALGAAGGLFGGLGAGLLGGEHIGRRLSSNPGDLHGLETGVDGTQRGLVPTQVLQDGAQAGQGGTEEVAWSRVGSVDQAPSPGLGPMGVRAVQAAPTSARGLDDRYLAAGQGTDRGLRPGGSRRIHGRTVAKWIVRPRSPTAIYALEKGTSRK